MAARAQCMWVIVVLEIIYAVISIIVLFWILSRERYDLTGQALLFQPRLIASVCLETGLIIALVIGLYKRNRTVLWTWFCIRSVLLGGHVMFGIVKIFVNGNSLGAGSILANAFGIFYRIAVLLIVKSFCDELKSPESTEITPCDSNPVKTIPCEP